MSTHPTIRTAILIGIVVATVQCDGFHRGTPTAPTVGTAHGPMTVSNLQAREIGLAHEVCAPASFGYVVHDELTFQVDGTTPDHVLGASLYQVAPDQTISLLGKVTECAVGVTPCTATTSVCFAKPDAGGGMVRVYTRVPWTPQRSWNLVLGDLDHRSNVLQALIQRPDPLPYSDRAGIAYFTAYRNSTTSGGYAVNIYSPGVPGRRITHTVDVFSGATRVFGWPTSLSSETPGSLLVGSTGGLLLAAGPSEVVVVMEERDASGALLASERKSIIVP